MTVQWALLFNIFSRVDKVTSIFSPSLYFLVIILQNIPFLFNRYAEAMLRDALSGVNEGIRVGGHLIKTMRFADD